MQHPQLLDNILLLQAHLSKHTCEQYVVFFGKHLLAAVKITQRAFIPFLFQSQTNLHSSRLLHTKKIRRFDCQQCKSLNSSCIKRHGARIVRTVFYMDFVSWKDQTAEKIISIEYSTQAKFLKLIYVPLIFSSSKDFSLSKSNALPKRDVVQGQF